MVLFKFSLEATESEIEDALTELESEGHKARRLLPTTTKEELKLFYVLDEGDVELVHRIDEFDAVEFAEIPPRRRVASA